MAYSLATWLRIQDLIINDERTRIESQCSTNHLYRRIYSHISTLSNSLFLYLRSRTNIEIQQEENLSRFLIHTLSTHERKISLSQSSRSREDPFESVRHKDG